MSESESKEQRSDPGLREARNWLEAASGRLGLDPAVIQELLEDLLDLTREVAHGPSRPAAPLTAFLVGLSAGRELGQDPGAAETVAATRTQLNRILDLLAEREAPNREN